MERLNIGLDFGTHQTKICIERSFDAANKQYELFLWEDMEGVKQICLPSIVQINRDKTVSYGFVDISNAYDSAHSKEDFDQEYQEPKKPVLTLPPPPKEPTYTPKETKTHKGKRLDEWQEKLLQLFKPNADKRTPEYKQYLKEKQDYDRDYAAWELECNKIKAKYNAKILSWERQCQVELERYNEALKSHIESSKLYFRYFKQASFTNVEWNKDIDADTLSIWYLAYVIFCLKDKCGAEFPIQMGVPTDYKSFESKRRKGAYLLINAYVLVEDIFNSDFERFKSTTYDELLELTPRDKRSEGDKDDYQVFLFPEAYVALEPLVQGRRLKEGQMSIMIDIGGGTTDVSFFTLRKEGLKIFKYYSFSRGLNFVDDSCSINHKVDKKLLHKYYVATINKSVEDIVGQLSRIFTFTGFEQHKLKHALQDNVLIYSGGGATRSYLRLKYDPFTDVRAINESILPINELLGLSSTSNIHPIIATCFGLAHARKSDKENKLESLETIFSHIKKVDDEYDTQTDYWLMDT